MVPQPRLGVVPALRRTLRASALPSQNQGPAGGGLHGPRHQAGRCPQGAEPPPRPSHPCLPQATHSPSGPLTSGAGPLRPGPPALRVHAPSSLWHSHRLESVSGFSPAGPAGGARQVPSQDSGVHLAAVWPGPASLPPLGLTVPQPSLSSAPSSPGAGLCPGGRLRTLQLPGGAGGSPPPTRSHSPGDFEACPSEAFFPCSPPPGSRRAQQPL